MLTRHGRACFYESWAFGMVAFVMFELLKLGSPSADVLAGGLLAVVIYGIWKV